MPTFIFCLLSFFTIRCTSENSTLEEEQETTSEEKSDTPNSSKSSPMGAKEKMQKIARWGIDVVAFYETSGANFSAVANNFDGQFVSWGFLQWNFGQGTLQPLLAEIIQKDEEGVKKVAGSSFSILKELSQSSPHRAGEICRAHILIGIDLRPEWKKIFVELGKLKASQEIQMKGASTYLKGALKEMNILKFKTVRSFITIFQNNVQNGFTYTTKDDDPASNAYRNWLKSNPNADEKLKIKKLAGEFLLLAVPDKNDEKVRRRCMTVIEGKGTVNGVYLDLAKDFKIDLDETLPPEYISSNPMDIF